MDASHALGRRPRVYCPTPKPSTTCTRGPTWRPPSAQGASVPARRHRWADDRDHPWMCCCDHLRRTRGSKLIRGGSGQSPKTFLAPPPPGLEGVREFGAI